MNRSASAISSSITQKSSSNRAAFASNRDTSHRSRLPPVRLSASDRCHRRQAAAQGRRHARPSAITDSAPRSASPVAMTSPKSPSLRRAARGRRFEPRRQALVLKRAIAGEARQRDVRAQEGAGPARAFLAARIDDPRLGDEHPARPLIQRPRPAPRPSLIGLVKWRLNAVVSRKRSLTRLLAA